jgi:hypothetical protein
VLSPDIGVVVERWPMASQRDLALPPTRRPGRPSGDIPDHVHPLVKRFFELLDASEMLACELCLAAGVANSTVSNWRRYSPQLASLEAVLNVLGYRLAIVPVAAEEAPGAVETAS